MADVFEALLITRDYPRAVIEAGERTAYYGLVGNEARAAGYRPGLTPVVVQIKAAMFHAIIGEMQDDDSTTGWTR